MSLLLELQGLDLLGVIYLGGDGGGGDGGGDGDGGDDGADGGDEPDGADPDPDANPDAIIAQFSSDPNPTTVDLGNGRTGTLSIGFSDGTGTGSTGNTGDTGNTGSTGDTG